MQRRGLACQSRVCAVFAVQHPSQTHPRYSMPTTRAIQKHYTKHQIAPPHTASSCLPHKQKQIMRKTRIGSNTIINVVSRAKMRAGMSRALTACSWANLARSHAFTLDAPPPLWCLSPVPLGSTRAPCVSGKCCHPRQAAVNSAQPSHL